MVNLQPARIFNKYSVPRCDTNSERVGHMAWWAFKNMLKTAVQTEISNKLMDKAYLLVFAMIYFLKDDVYNFLTVCMKN